MPRSPKKNLTVEELANDQRVYGKRNKARSLEPSLFEILTWEVNHDDHRYLKKTRELCRQFGDYNHFKYLINRAGDPFVSEAHDNYRPFEYQAEQDEYEEGVEEDDMAEGQTIHRNEMVEQRQPTLKHSQSVKPASKNQLRGEKTDMIKVNNQATAQIKKLNDQGHVSKQMVQSSSVNILKPHQPPKDHEKKRQVKIIGSKENPTHSNLMPERPITGKITDMDPTDFENSEEHQYRVALKKMQQQANAKTPAEKQQENRRVDRIKKFNEQTRWLPNSGFQTYYGKPAFENYGFRNTNPSWGGLMYGSYLKSFNINPQRGANQPKFDQVFISSQLAADRVNYDRDHMPRKCKDEYVHSQKEVKELINRLPLTIKQEAPVKKCGVLKKPDLLASKRFMSKTEDELDKEDHQRPFTNKSQTISQRQEASSAKVNPFLVAKHVIGAFSKQRPNTAKVPKSKPGHLTQHEVGPQVIIPVYDKDMDSYDENNVCDLRTMKIGKGTHPAFSNKFIESKMDAQPHPGNGGEGRKITFAASQKNKQYYWQ
jgi:hypothetical protein